MSKSILEVHSLSFSYTSYPLLKNLSFSIQPGEICALIGVSGSGKSTLFKLLTGILPMQGGSIKVEREQIAYMMQEDLLLPWRNVMDNILLPLELGKKKDFPNRNHEALKILEEVGLPSCSKLFPHELSGGMRQRVSLARALMQKRSLILLDEPFGSLDIILRDQMTSLLHAISSKTGTAIFFITHDFRDALALADKIFILSQGTLRRTWEHISKIRKDYYALGEVQEEMKNELLLNL